MKTFHEWLLNENTAFQKEADYLRRVESDGYRLLVHQTHADTAMNMMRSQSFKTGGNASGTSAMVGTDSLLGAVNALTEKKMGNNDYASGLVHRGSDAVLVMAIPRITTVNGEKTEIRRADDLDAVLGDLAMEGKLKGMEIPNNYILGVWVIEGSTFHSDHGLVMNNNFDPKKGPI